MIRLSLNGKAIDAEEITFKKRLEFDDDLKYMGADEDWEIFLIKGTSHYVAYQQDAGYYNCTCDTAGICGGTSCPQYFKCHA